MENSEHNLFFDSSLLDSPELGNASEVFVQSPANQALEKPLQVEDEFELSRNFYEPLQLVPYSSVVSDPVVEDKKKGKKRGRRKIDESEEEKKLRRAENNRRAARNNRDRKRIYVEQLEARVNFLSTETEYYKARLSRYEIVEQHRNLFGYEISRTYSRAISRIGNMIIKDPTDYIGIFRKEFQLFVKERCTALNELTKSIVEISLPLPWRVLFLTVGCNIDVLSLQKLLPSVNSITNEGDVKEIVQLFREKISTRFQAGKNRKLFIASITKIKSLIKTVVQLQKEIQIEIMKISNYLGETLAGFLSPYTGQVLSQFTALLRNAPEVSDRSMYQLEDSDFNVATEYDGISLANVQESM